MTGPRQEYELTHGQVDVGTKRRPRLVDTVSAVAKNVDCGACGCPSVRNGGTVQTPPPPRCRVRLPVPRHVALCPEGGVR